jgi:hypothetical protein
VQDADREQHAHAPGVEPGEALAALRDLERDAETEQEREERVDLVLEQDLDQPQARVVGEAGARERELRAVGRREEVLRVLDEDAEQRCAAQDVEALQAFARRRRREARGGARVAQLRASPRAAD